jgi:TrkA-N domain/RyR domain
MADARGIEKRRTLTRVTWGIAIPAVLGLGLWGYLGLGEQPASAVYRTLKLFTFSLDVPQGKEAPPQLWVALFLGGAVTARGLAVLFKDRLAGVLTAYVSWPQVVIFGANPRASVLIRALLRAEDPPGWWRNAVVVVDPDPVALATITAPRVRKVTGGGTSEVALIKAGVRRAAAVVLVTGDHVRNSAITTQILRAAPDLLRRPSLPRRLCERLLGIPARTRLDVFVEVAGFGLAGVLEQGGHRAGVEITTISAPTRAMAHVLDAVEAKRAGDGLPALLAADREGASSTVAVFGTGALVDAAVLDLYRRRRLDLLPDTPPPPPRVLLFGPDAQDRRAALVALLGTDLQVIEIDAVDVDLGQLVELDIETARHLARHRPRQVLVCVPTDPGCGIAVALARHLGRAERVVVVNESPLTPTGDEIVQQAADSPLLSPITLHTMPQLAYPLPELRRERRADRLAAALPADDRAAPDRRAAAVQMITATGRDGAVVRRDPLAELRRPHLALLDALRLTPGMAMARAGLTVDFENPATVLRAAETLLAAGAPEAFATWCEVARLQTTTTSPAAPVDSDVRELLELRRATLGDRAGLDGAPVNPDTGAAGRLIVICADPYDADRAEFLRYTWRRLPSDFVVWSTGAPGSAQAHVAADEGVALRHADGQNGRARALAIWRTILAARRDPAAVRVVALPGASQDEILIARALGATVGRVETAAGSDLAQDFLGGGTDIVPLPDDRMTVRAFLRRSEWPDEVADPEPIAAGLHYRYVRRQRGVRKDASDPVLLPWDALSPWLRDSNLAVVDNIPDKLASLDLRLACPGEDLDCAVDVRQVVADNLELLAEQEHGRFIAERLTSGWTGGVRDPARFMSPHLKPWDEIDEEAKEFDREVLEDVFAAMTDAGVRVVPAH